MITAIGKKIRLNGEYRFGRWGTFAHRFAIAHWRWSIALCKFEDHWSLHLFCLWITLWQTKTPPAEILDQWGIDFDSDFQSIRFCWGGRSKAFYMPWSYEHCLTEAMLKDFTFMPFDRFPPGWIKNGETPESAHRYVCVLPYHYTLRSGGVQERMATVKVDRMTWCWRAWPFSSLRWPRKTKTYIDVKFSDEVGEETGSWKGGCIGCGYELLPGEQPDDCLRRMEKERKF